jgi:hypothetical protein
MKIAGSVSVSSVLYRCALSVYLAHFAGRWRFSGLRCAYHLALILLKLVWVMPK